MGYYVQEKVEEGAENAVKIAKPSNFNEIPADKALICVIDNGIFKARGYMYSEGEFKEFASSSDYRPKEWYLLDKSRAEELSGYKR